MSIIPENRLVQVLDHGFVELIDSMGSDLTVTNSARVSHGKRKSEFDDKDAKLIKYLADNNHWSPFRHVQFQFHMKMPEFVARQAYKHCYSEDTEVLTPSGWVKFSELKQDVEVAQVSPDSSTFEFVKPSDYISRFHNGEMYEFKTQSMSLCVTDEHRMVVHKRVGHEWSSERIELAKNLMRGEFKLPLQPSFAFPVEGSEKDYCFGKLYGFFLSDGGISSKERIVFSFKKDRKKEFLFEIIANLGLNPHINEFGREGYTVFHLDNPDTCLFKGKCTDDSKSIDLEYTLKNKAFAQGVFDGLVNGDGHITEYDSIRYASSQQNLAEDVSLLANYLGYTAKIGEYRESQFVVGISKNKNRHFLNKARIPYEGNVYCITVPTGKLLVRRDGCIAVCGNCVGIAYSEGGSREIDHAWNEISQRYVDASDFDYYTPEAFREQSENNKQASQPADWGEGKNEELKTCYRGMIEIAIQDYKTLLSTGVAKEQARAVLPLAIYTEFYWTASLQALVNFIKLRRHPHAQWEIRQYAEALEGFVKQVVPVSYAALMAEEVA